MLYVVRDCLTNLMYGPFFTLEDAEREAEYNDFGHYWVFKIAGEDV